MNWPFPMLVNLLIETDQVDEKDFYYTENIIRKLGEELCEVKAYYGRYQDTRC
jgi:hypothetical protein